MITVDRVAEYVCRRRGVSVVELRREFNAKGNWNHEVCPNIFDMIGITKELGEAVEQAVRANRISVNPSHLLVYLMDGEVPSLPIAKRITTKGKSKPHWFPVEFDRPIEGIK
jgi:hypothetical protein